MKIFQCPRKQKAREETIIKVGKAFFQGEAGLTFLTLSGPLTTADSPDELALGTELSHLVSSGLIQSQNYFGIDNSREKVEANQRAVLSLPVEKRPTFLWRGFTRGLAEYVEECGVTPCFVNFDTQYEVGNAINDLVDILKTLNGRGLDGVPGQRQICLVNWVKSQGRGGKKHQYSPAAFNEYLNRESKSQGVKGRVARKILDLMYRGGWSISTKVYVYRGADGKVRSTTEMATTWLYRGAPLELPSTNGFFDVPHVIPTPLLLPEFEEERGLVMPAGNLLNSKKRSIYAWTTEKYLTEGRLNIFCSITGSGKSSLCMLRAHLHASTGKVVLIAVPEMSIAEGFREERPLSLSQETTTTWRLPNTDSILLSSTTTQIRNKVQTEIEREFQKGTIEASVEGAVYRRIFVITHSTLVNLHKHCPELLSRCHVIIDEAQACKCEGDESDSPTLKEFDNKVGAVVRSFIEKTYSGEGSLDLVTATPFRGDGFRMLPDRYIHAFNWVEQPARETIQNYRHIQEIVINFVLPTESSEVENYMSYAVKELRNHPDKRTAVYFQPVRKGGRERKLAQVQAIKDRLKLVPKGPLLVCGEVRCIDLVTEEGRPERWDLAKEILKGKNYSAVLSQNLLLKGTDIPFLDRIICFSPRGSLTIMYQMMGRLLRDREGKSVVQMDIVLPPWIGAEGEVEELRMQTYIEATFNVMLLGMIFSSALSFDLTREDFEKLKRRLLTPRGGAGIPGGATEEDDIEMRSILSIFQGSLKLLASRLLESRPDLAPIVEGIDREDPRDTFHSLFKKLNCGAHERYLAKTLGSVRPLSLRDLRLAVDKLGGLPVSEEKARRVYSKIFQQIPGAPPPELVERMGRFKSWSDLAINVPVKEAN